MSPKGVHVYGVPHVNRGSNLLNCITARRGALGLGAAHGGALAAARASKATAATAALRPGVERRGSAERGGDKFGWGRIKILDEAEIVAY